MDKKHYCQSHLCESCKHYALIDSIFSFYSVGRITENQSDFNTLYAFADVRLLWAHCAHALSMTSFSIMATCNYFRRHFEY